MPTIYYIRHGETEWNALGRLQGTQDIPLNDLGRKQAASAGAILAGLFARDGRSEASLEFVASPLVRARSTMELVRNSLSLPPDQYAIDPRLREIGYGQWEGATLAQMQVEDPDLFARRQTDCIAVGQREKPGERAGAVIVAIIIGIRLLTRVPDGGIERAVIEQPVMRQAGLLGERRHAVEHVGLRVQVGKIEDQHARVCGKTEHRQSRTRVVGDRRLAGGLEDEFRGCRRRR